MSVPASPRGSLALPPGPLRHGMGVVSFALGLMAALGIVAYAVWMALATLSTADNAAAPVGSSDSPLRTPSEHRVAAQHAPAITTPTATSLSRPTPAGTTLGFDQLWISRDGNTITAGPPTMDVSQRGEPVIRIPVTLTNNGTQDWNPESTTFGGKLNRATVPESNEGDWRYRAPIAGRTSVTLTKVFVAHPGQFTLIVDTPQGEALFAGQV